MKALVTSLLLVVVAAPAWAVLGLPYAQEAVVHEGQMRITGGLTIGELPDGDADVLMFGGRFGYGVIDGLELFGGLGLISVDVDMDDDPDAVDLDFDNEPYVQIGGLYILPLDLPFDVGLRGAVGYARLEDSFRESEAVDTPGGPATINISGKIEVDLLSINAGVLASKALNPVVSVYGFVGVSHTRVETDGSARVTSDNPYVMQALEAEGESRQSVSESGSSTDLAVAGGLLVNLAEHFSLYAEVAHIDEVWASAGGRLSF